MSTKAIVFTDQSKERGYYPVTLDYPILWVILLLSTFVRFNGLDKPGLWLDEAAYTIAAQRPIISQITNPTETLGDYLSVDPTLSAIPFSLSLKLGFSNFIARFPAALFGILSVALIYRLGRALFGNLVGLVAALLLCTSSFHLLYSQEARSYAQFIFFCMASFFFLHQATIHNHLRTWSLYLFCTWAGVSTNHLMLFVIPAQGLFLCVVCLKNIILLHSSADVIRTSIRLLGYFLVSLFIVFILRLPWWEDFTQRQCAGCDIGNPTYSLDLIGSAVRSVQAYTRAAPAIAALLIILQLLGLFLALYHFPVRGLLLAGWLIASILVTTFGLWFISQFFHERYTIWGLPPFFLTVAYGLVSLAQYFSRYLSSSSRESPSTRLAKAIEFTGIAFLLLPIALAGLYTAQQNPTTKQSWPVGQLQDATSYIARQAKNQEMVIGVPNAQYLQLYLQPVRPDLMYLDARSTAIPKEFAGVWYVFYDVQNIPPRWPEQVDFKRFHDLLLVYRPGACSIQTCIKETQVLFTEMIEANPGTALAEKINLMLAGLAKLII